MLPRLIRQALVLSGGALVAFHAWLFAGQAAAGRLEDPWLLFRWVAAASLLAALAAVHRSGQSVWGRKGIAIWVLAALLHGPAVSNDVGIESVALPETVATSIVQLIASAAVGIGLWMLARLVRSRRRAAVRFAFDDVAAPVFGLPVAIAAPQFSPRPPPHSA